MVNQQKPIPHTPKPKASEPTQQLPQAKTTLTDQKIDQPSPTKPKTPLKKPKIESELVMGKRMSEDGYNAPVFDALVIKRSKGSQENEAKITAEAANQPRQTL